LRPASTLKTTVRKARRALGVAEEVAELRPQVEIRALAALRQVLNVLEMLTPISGRYVLSHMDTSKNPDSAEFMTNKIKDLPNVARGF
jgi:hypothetical protein